MALPLVFHKVLPKGLPVVIIRIPLFHNSSQKNLLSLSEMTTRGYANGWVGR